jgi:16S rRNA (uracil1498-N3)-methyltransferase
MNLVYCPLAAVDSIVVPDENEFHHLQVLRAHEGESLHIIDGRGNLYQGTLMSMGKRSAAIQIAALIRSDPPATARLHIAIAPTKNIDRLEWFAEKATEIGVNTITPVTCQRSERRVLRLDRIEKVVLSAAKQSLRLHLPEINDVISLPSFIQANKSGTSKKFIAHCGDYTVLLKNCFLAQESIIVLIGPEGDFTDEEVRLAEANGFISVSLGEGRLRTETAGVMVSAIFAINNE